MPWSRGVLLGLGGRHRIKPERCAGDILSCWVTLLLRKQLKIGRNPFEMGDFKRCGGGQNFLFYSREYLLLKTRYSPSPPLHCTGLLKWGIQIADHFHR